MITAFMNLITTLVDVVLVPFGDSRLVGLCGLSLLAGMAMIWMFKATSDQRAIKKSRDQFKARILEMRIYQDDIVLIMKALARALATNATYLRISLKPILVLVIFAVGVFIQLDQRYGVDALSPDETALLTVTLKEGTDPMVVPMSLEMPAGVVLDSSPVRVASRREINWRIRAKDLGIHDVTLSAYGKKYTFAVAAQSSQSPIGRDRTTSKWTDNLIHIGMPPLPANAPIASISLAYPQADYYLFGWRLHWIVIFIVFSTVGALIPKFLFGIEV